MKMRYNKWRLTAVILLFLSALAFSAPACGENRQMTYTEWKDRILNLQRIMFNHHQKGIGLGDCPVYTAPSKKALRFANNRQAVDTNKEIYEAGKTEDGWLLVRYDPGNGKIRTGYIPPEKVSKFKSGSSLKGKFDCIPVIAADRIEVTDDPITGKNIFATLSRNDSFLLLAKYTYHGNWWYIECTVDGKTARGFIDREESFFYPGEDIADSMYQASVNLENLGMPSFSPLNTRQMGKIEVNGEKQTRKSVYREAGEASGKLTAVYPGRTYPYYAVKTDSKGSKWYYIFVEEDTLWGWVSAKTATATASENPAEYKYVNENGEYFVYTLDQDGGAVLKGYGVQDLANTPETIRIPAMLDGWPLRSIGRCAFDRSEYDYDGEKAKQLVLPEGLTMLEELALYDIFGIQEVFLPATLADSKDEFTERGITAVFHVADGNPRYAAYNGFLIDKLEDALIYAAPSSTAYPLPEVKGFKALSLHYYSPEQIVFPKTAEYIDSYACYDNIDTISVMIPGNVETIADNAFYAMIAEEITLQNGIRCIGAHAFYDTEIMKLNIPESVEWLGFEFCNEWVKVSGHPAEGCYWETEEEYYKRMKKEAEEGLSQP